MFITDNYAHELHTASAGVLRKSYGTKNYKGKKYGATAIVYVDGCNFSMFPNLYNIVEDKGTLYEVEPKLE